MAERLLDAVGGLERAPLGAAEECCGFGGLFSVKHGAVSSAMLARKLTGIACNAPIDNMEAELQPTAPRLGDINALFDEAGIGTALRRQAERVSDIYRH